MPQITSAVFIITEEDGSIRIQLTAGRMFQNTAHGNEAYIYVKMLLILPNTVDLLRMLNVSAEFRQL